MSVSLYEGERYDPKRFVTIMMAVNLAICVVVLFSWPIVGPLLADPISAAAESSLDGTHTPSIVDYPYVVLWLLPMLGAVGSWLTSNLGQPTLSKFLAAYPLLLIISSCAWYWYLSNTYQ